MNSVPITDTDQQRIDARYMQRCLQLAKAGRETCQPNPMVGAVLVKDGRIIGEGWHQRVGMPHAEPMAINAVKDEALLREATLYVNLEPCSHYGKTPPCVDLILSKHIPRIVIGTPDIFPLVSGRGIKKLREHGVDVTVGVEVKACKALNRHFFTFHALKRPYITLKWAMTADGYLDKLRTLESVAPPLIVSTPFTRILTHKVRSENAVILVGKKTALLDNPSLTVREWSGQHPVRAVIDRKLELPTSLNLFDQSVPTLIFTETPLMDCKNLTYIQLDYRKSVVEQLLDVFYQRNLQTLLVEGGTTLHQSFLDKGLWDEIHIETSDQQIHTGVLAPTVQLGENTFYTKRTIQDKQFFRALQQYVSTPQGVFEPIIFKGQ